MAKGNPDPSPETRFQSGHQVPTKFGGEGALVRIRKGEPFIGLALEVLEGVLSELGVNLNMLSGIEGILVKRAARFEAAARMFDMAADSAAAEGDVDRWEKYHQRAGWIGGKAYYALADLRDKLKLAGGVVTDYEEVLSEAD